ncbi:MAG: (2Fe-2S)-binding protein [Planctomycetes bacterium]|nr:(2Fe-2S)-binding protein [Planctomycetota bacterium]
MSGSRLPGQDQRPAVTFTFAGRPVVARAGDSIAMALWAAGERELRRSSGEGRPRGVYCNMGVCFDCLVVVDGVTVRGCTTTVQDGMRVERGGRP